MTTTAPPAPEVTEATAVPAAETLRSELITLAGESSPTALRAALAVLRELKPAMDTPASEETPAAEEQPKIDAWVPSNPSAFALPEGMTEADLPPPPVRTAQEFKERIAKAARSEVYYTADEAFACAEKAMKAARK